MRQLNYASHFDSSARASEVRSKLDWNAFHQKRRGQASTRNRTLPAQNYLIISSDS